MNQGLVFCRWRRHARLPNATWSVAFWFAFTAICGLQQQLTSLVAAAEPLRSHSELGPVKTTLELAPSNPLIGDPVELTLTVVAEKDVELLLPEFGESLQGFVVLDFVPRQTIDDQGRTMATQKYRLQPPSSGPQVIPPILIEFVDRRAGQRPAPTDQDAYELVTERMEFEVQSVVPKDAQTDLQPPLGKLDPLAPPAAPRWPWFVAGALAVAACVPVAIGFWRAYRRRARRRSAYDIARTRLDKLLARQRPDGKQVDEFFVELSSLIRRYLEDRFELRAPELTTEEFLASVGQTTDLSRDHQVLLREFLRQADLVKFAGARPTGDDIDRSIQAARRFLEETRENAPLIEEDATGTRREVVGADR